MKYLLSLAIFWLFYALVAHPLIDAAAHRLAKVQAELSERTK